jgi:ATP-dependent DNA ligase
LPDTKKALRSLRVKSCVIDGERVGPGDVFALHRVISDYREDLICIAAFDLLALNGIDLRTLPLSGWARRQPVRRFG